MIEKIIENMGQVIIGKEEIIEQVVVALLAKGHILIEDVPGVGKTTLAKSLANSVNCDFSRIQFTPDLLPSDILGVSIYNQKVGEFEYKKGPLHNQVILADEINRASPKTQSSLLEAMEERQITMDGVTYPLEEPFMVMATQNPIEYDGTFPLPEAQLDRFMLKINIGYPDEQSELSIFRKVKSKVSAESLASVLTVEEILKHQEAASQVFVKDQVEKFIVDVVRATRKNENLILGCSPRATIGLYSAAKAYAYIKGREFVTPEDVKRLAKPVLAHRLILKPEVKYRGISSEMIVEQILKEVNAPLVE